MRIFEHPPVPYDLVANEAASWTFLGFTAVSALAVLIWALSRAVRSNDTLPLIFMAGGAMCGFVEAPGDILGATFYPLNTPLLVFYAFGRHIPLFVFVGESMFFALAVYIAYRFLAAGMSPARLLGVVAAFSVFDAAMEMTVIHFHVMTYYGNNPVLVFGLPLYSIVQNGALAVVGGWLVLLLAPRLQGLKALWFVLVIPVGFFAQAFITTWPMYFGLNSDLPRSIMLVLGLLATAMNLALPIWCIYSPTSREYRDRASRMQTHPPAIAVSSR